MNHLEYRHIRGMSEEEMTAYLKTKGLSDEEVRDFVLDFTRNKIVLRSKQKNTKFSESRAFQDITERMERLKEKMRGSNDGTRRTLQ